MTTRVADVEAAATTAAAAASRSLALLPTTSTNNHPWPPGSGGTAPGPEVALTTSTMRASSPSQAVGAHGSRAGASSAASAIEG